MNNVTVHICRDDVNHAQVAEAKRFIRLSRKRAWNRRNREQQARYKREWEARNAEKRRAYQAAYYQRNKKRLNAESLVRYYKNHETVRPIMNARQRERRRANRMWNEIYKSKTG